MCDREQRNHKGLRELGIITVSRPEGERTKRPCGKEARRVSTFLTFSLPPVSDQCSQQLNTNGSRRANCYGPCSSAYQVTEQNAKGWKGELGSKQQRNAARCAVLSCFSCVRLCDPMDCSPPGSPVHGIPQVRILERVAVPSSRGSSQPRDGTQASHIAGGFFTV